MKIKIEDYEIICDTREQDTLIQDTLIKKGIKTAREKLDTGDYAIRYQGEYIPNILIERKANLDELLGNLLDPVKDENKDNRFIRELKRAKAAGVKLFLLIQDKDYYIKLLKGQYISNVHPNASAAMVISLMAKFDNLHIIACNRKESPSMVHKILYYHLREEIKSKEDN
jgi:ERCC4-type nuclease